LNLETQNQVQKTARMEPTKESNTYFLISKSRRRKQRQMKILWRLSRLTRNLSRPNSRTKLRRKSKGQVSRPSLSSNTLFTRLRNTTGIWRRRRVFQTKMPRV
jgi:hypothetical protein